MYFFLVNDPASQLLQHYSDEISKIVFVPNTAPVLWLHEEGVISKKIANEIEAFGGTIEGQQFLALQFAVAEDHSKVKLFVTILQKMNVQDAILLASKIDEDYGEGIHLV